MTIIGSILLVLQSYAWTSASYTRFQPEMIPAEVIREKKVKAIEIYSVKIRASYSSKERNYQVRAEYDEFSRLNRVSTNRFYNSDQWKDFQTKKYAGNSDTLIGVFFDSPDKDETYYYRYSPDKKELITNYWNEVYAGKFFVRHSFDDSYRLKRSTIYKITKSEKDTFATREINYIYSGSSNILVRSESVLTEADGDQVIKITEYSKLGKIISEIQYNDEKMDENSFTIAKYWTYLGNGYLSSVLVKEKGKDDIMFQYKYHTSGFLQYIEKFYGGGYWERFVLTYYL